ncbi:MAG: T9SS type A sorting domain-containing protein [Bacteroidia bacterium]|nr:T9SS type A sorting domain-containing protein [Bacteroidia bacterium]
MKRIIILTTALVFGLSINAQNWIEDSVTLENKSVKQIYYSFKTQNQHVADAVGWDLAFSVQNTIIPNQTLQATTIRVNNGKSVKVYLAPDSIDVSNFSALDTTGYKSTWTELLDSDSTWDIGAFNTGLDLTIPPSMGGPKYGWGNYDEDSHDVKSLGRVYLIVRGNVFRKLYFGDLVGDNTYHFTYADLDNNNQHTDSIKKSAYPDRYFVYYDLTNKTVKDLEPSKADWDVVFTNYWTLVHSPMGPSQMMSYPGTLSKKGVKVARIENELLDSAWGATRNFTEQINTIGGDWKTHVFDSLGSRYVYKDSLSFVIDNGGDSLYLLHFTRYGGSANTRMVFEFQKTAKPVGPIDGVAIVSKSNLLVYPNPVSSELFLDVEGIAQIQILDLQGKTIINKELNHTNKIDVSNLPNGLYIIKVIMNNDVYTSKILKAN